MVIAPPNKPCQVFGAYLYGCFWQALIVGTMARYALLPYWMCANYTVSFVVPLKLNDGARQLGINLLTMNAYNTYHCNCVIHLCCESFHNTYRNWRMVLDGFVANLHKFIHDIIIRKIM